MFEIDITQRGTQQSFKAWMRKPHLIVSSTIKF